MTQIISGSNDLSETMNKNIPFGAVPAVEIHGTLVYCAIIRLISTIRLAELTGATL